MAPTEGRVARPERRWGCRHGTHSKNIYGAISTDGQGIIQMAAGLQRVK